MKSWTEKIVYPSEERRLAQLDGIGEQRVEGKKQRHLQQKREAAPQRIDVVLLVQRHDLLVHLGPLWVGLLVPPILFLDHLRGAEEIREAFELQEITFIPAAIPPHKSSEEVVEAKHRLEMVRLATADNPFFSTNDIELSRILRASGKKVLWAVNKN
jgi:hypothetical protein